jgi:hypothetical protein
MCTHGKKKSHQEIHICFRQNGNSIQNQFSSFQITTAVCPSDMKCVKCLYTLRPIHLETYYYVWYFLCSVMEQGRQLGFDDC